MRQHKRCSKPIIEDLIAPEPGNRVVEQFDSKFTPCGCVSHRFYVSSLPVVQVELIMWHRVKYYCCLACGTLWDHDWQLERAEQLGGSVSTWFN